MNDFKIKNDDLRKILKGEDYKAISDIKNLNKIEGLEGKELTILDEKGNPIKAFLAFAYKDEKAMRRAMQNAINALMHAHSLKQNELAEKSDVYTTGLSNYFTHDDPQSMKLVMKCLQALGATITIETEHGILELQPLND